MSELRELARDLALRAGELVEKRRAEGVSVETTKSSDVDVVTLVDREVEEWLRAEILAARPDDSIAGEEGDAHVGTSEYTWILDPIDGTVNFLYGLPYYSVSVAVARGNPEPEEWELVAGAVCAPALNTVWDAGLGEGAARNGVPLGPPSAKDLSQSLLVTGFGYSAELRALQGRIIADLLPRVRDIRRLGSAAIDLCLLADGSVDIYYELALNSWDMAAGTIVAAEAGHAVKITPKSGHLPRLVIVGHPHSVAELGSHVREFSI